MKQCVVVLGFCLSGMMMIAQAVQAQVVGTQRMTVQGRVFDAGSRDGIPNAIVSLEGHGYRVSTGSGSFSFDRVLPGSYLFRVEAYGYREAEQLLHLLADTIITVALHVDPVLLEGIEVKLETFDFDGRVKDPEWRSNLRNAEVVSDQGHNELTNFNGSFDLDGVFERIPLRLLIQAFGYLPMDTTFVPDGDERHPFHVVPDPISNRMVEDYNELLEDRMDGHMYKFQQPIDREDMARLPGNASLQIVMESRYYRHILRRVGCFFVDNRRILSREERTALLQSMLVSELQRIELLEFVTPGGGRGFMARVYTQEFFRSTIGPHNEPMRRLTWSLCG